MTNRLIFALLSCAAAAAIWHFAPMVLNDEFLFLGRFCGIIAALSVLENAAKKVTP